MANAVDEARIWLLKEFSASLALAFEGMLGERPTVETTPDRVAPGEGWISWKQAFSNLPGAGWLTALEQTWVDAGGSALRGAGIDDADAPTAKSTFVEIITQAFSALARAITGHIRSEVNCSPGEESTPGGINWTSLSIRLPGGIEARIALGFDEEFVARLREAVTESVTQAETAPPPTSKRASETGPTSKTLELLLDVELPVSVSFGRAVLPLKDVIKLTTGAIVELNRTIAEPVEVIVNNCVIARGEVVVVDGNFGVRIQQVISRQDRLRTLY